MKVLITSTGSEEEAALMGVSWVFCFFSQVTLVPEAVEEQLGGVQ